MIKRCSFKIHPDGYNGELPRLHEFSEWKPCRESATVVVPYPRASSDGLPACERHGALFRENA